MHYGYFQFEYSEIQHTTVEFYRTALSLSLRTMTGLYSKIWLGRPVLRYFGANLCRSNLINKLAVLLALLECHLVLDAVFELCVLFFHSMRLCFCCE